MEILIVFLLLLNAVFSFNRESMGISCDDATEEEIKSLFESIERTVQVLVNEKSEITADVVMGFMIAYQFLLKSPHDNDWRSKIQHLEKSMATVTGEFLERLYGNHIMSSDLIPLMLNATLWENAVQPLQDINNLGNGLKDVFKLYFSHTSQHYSNGETQKLPSFSGRKSDQCLKELFIYDCRVNGYCFMHSDKSLPNGYERTHFLLFLQIASALNCTAKNPRFFSENTGYLRIYLCNMILEDILYRRKEPTTITELDLLLEEIALCGVEGDVGFANLRIYKLLQYEKDGCFDVKSYHSVRRNKRNVSFTRKGCQSHTSAVGLSALSFFVRFLLTQCY